MVINLLSSKNYLNGYKLNWPSRNLASMICISDNYITTLGSSYSTIFSKENVISMNFLRRK